MNARAASDVIGAPVAPSTLGRALLSWLPTPAHALKLRRWWTLVLIAWGEGSGGLPGRVAAARACLSHPADDPLPA